MQWDASEKRRFTTGTPWIGVADNYKAINAAAQLDDPDSIRSFYKNWCPCASKCRSSARAESNFVPR